MGNDTHISRPPPPPPKETPGYHTTPYKEVNKEKKKQKEV